MVVLMGPNIRNIHETAKNGGNLGRRGTNEVIEQIRYQFYLDNFNKNNGLFTQHDFRRNCDALLSPQSS